MTTAAPAPDVTTAQAIAWVDDAPRWITVALPGGCTGWTDQHDCGREDDHPGDHVCVCGDQWNRGEWDDYDADDDEYFRSQRPEDRCAAGVGTP